jgi:acyl carrier protein
VVALAGLELALRTREPGVAVVDVDWSRFARSFASMRARPLLEDISEAREAMGKSASADDVGSLRDTLLALPMEERPAATLELVQAEIAMVLGIKSAAAVDPDEPLEALGLDSLMAVQLRDRFSVLTDTALPTTLAFDFPTPRELADHFTTLLGGDDAVETAAESEHIDDEGPDVESMDTDELLALLEEKYGEEGDA